MEAACLPPVPIREGRPHKRYFFLELTKRKYPEVVYQGPRPDKKGEDLSGIVPEPWLNNAPPLIK